MPKTCGGDKRNQILLGAAKAFAQKGFFESRISDVAKAAKVADGTIYLYFENKNQLLKSLFEESVALLIKQATEYLAKSGTPLEQLTHLCCLHLKLLEKNPDHAVVFQIELRQGLRSSERFSQERLASYLKIIKGIIEDGQHKGVFRKNIHPALAANMCFGILDELATRWVLANLSYPLTRDLDQMTMFFFSGLLATANE
ncbi:MAG: TetR/AcrR family transcriptional regulator [Planctomycetota bacterium]